MGAFQKNISQFCGLYFTIPCWFKKFKENDANTQFGFMPRCYNGIIHLLPSCIFELNIISWMF